MSDYLLNRQISLNTSIFNPDYTVEKSLYTFIEKHLNHHYEVVLDYGAGNSPLRKIISHTRYLKADISQNHDKSIDFILDSGQIPLADASVDLIICKDVLEHVPDLFVVVNEFMRVLKPNGLIFLSVPFLYREHEAPYDYYRFTSFFMRHLFSNSDSGNSIITLEKAGNAFFCAYILLNEMHIKFGETVEQTVLGRLSRKVFNCTLLPLLNTTVFKFPPQIAIRSSTIFIC